MSRVVKVVDQRIAAVQGPIQVLFLAGLLISFVVVAAAACSRSPHGGSMRACSPSADGVRIRRCQGRAGVRPPVRGRRDHRFVVATGLIAWIGPRGHRPGGARVGAGGSIVATLGVLAVVGVVSRSRSCRITSRDKA
jgi:hypothetical protein